MFMVRAVSLARFTTPLHDHVVHVTNYPVTKAVAAMARQIVGRETDAMAQAGVIERYMSTRFHYIPNPALIGHAMSVDAFLLREHRGHCEYFAAGMVALLTSLNVPARIVGEAGCAEPARDMNQILAEKALDA